MSVWCAVTLAHAGGCCGADRGVPGAADGVNEPGAVAWALSSAKQAAESKLSRRQVRRLKWSRQNGGHGALEHGELGRQSTHRLPDKLWVRPELPARACQCRCGTILAARQLGEARLPGPIAHHVQVAAW